MVVVVVVTYVQAPSAVARRRADRRPVRRHSDDTRQTAADQLRTAARLVRVPATTGVPPPRRPPPRRRPLQTRRRPVPRRQRPSIGARVGSTPPDTALQGRAPAAVKPQRLAPERN